jgi:glucose/mannose transport system permease protein
VNRARQAGAAGRAAWYADPGRWGLLALTASAAAFFLLPLYVMAITSLKSMDEIRLGHLFALPTVLTLDAWHAAWSNACTGVACEGIRGGFWNSASFGKKCWTNLSSR